MLVMSFQSAAKPKMDPPAPDQVSVLGAGAALTASAVGAFSAAERSTDALRVVCTTTQAGRFTWVIFRSEVLSLAPTSVVEDHCLAGGRFRVIESGAAIVERQCWRPARHGDADVHRQA